MLLGGAGLHARGRRLLIRRGSWAAGQGRIPETASRGRLKRGAGQAQLTQMGPGAKARASP